MFKNAVKAFYNKHGIKYLLYAFFATILIFILAFIVVKIIKHDGDKTTAVPVSTQNEPYICFEGLDWGMPVEDCFTILHADKSRFKSYVDKSPYGFESTAYTGKTRIFDRMSDVTLWFTSYAANEPPGLSVMIIANVYTKGADILPKFEKMFDQKNVTKLVSQQNHLDANTPYISNQVEWQKGKFDEVVNIDFPKAWEKYINENSSKKANALASEYLSVGKLQYIENGKRYRIDLRGEPAAYYNYLRKQLAK